MDKSALILLLPLLAFVVNGIFLGKKPRVAAFFSILIAALNVALAVVLAMEWHSIRGVSEAVSKPLFTWTWNWLPLSNDFTIQFSMMLDPISVMMAVVITAIALMVNIYSVGYLRGDAGFSRFFAKLSLFTFSMLGLVLAGNLFQMFVFWELVGVTSYLLIGFWYFKPSAVAASKKAFIMTRFADSFFLIGIVIIGYFTHNLDFALLTSPAGVAQLDQPVNLGFATFSALSIGTLFVFAGGWGKSAMFPLHVWLPDAMEGPTPVSSIIHSATMVVAGVYLTARLFPLFAASVDTLQVVEFIGAFTAIFAAIIAATQMDIKRILAYSTLSQLGYMMFSLGTSMVDSQTINSLGYSASMFHVFTHAFFKCMLFLGAGALIHAVHSNSLADMGGLRKQMPLTFAAMLLATLAIAGIPPLSGFWSKDEILLAAWQTESYGVFSIALLTGGLTSFYMFRLFFLAFTGKSRAHGHHHVHEDKWMTTPILLLTIPTVFAGWIFRHSFTEIFVLDMPHLAEFHDHPHWLPYVAAGLGFAGLLLAWFLYGRSKSDLQSALRYEKRPAWYVVIRNKFYFDEIYLWITRKIIFEFVAESMKAFDRAVDWLMDAGAMFAQGSGRLIRAFQSGLLPYYIGAMIFGILLIRYLGNLPL